MESGPAGSAIWRAGSMTVEEEKERKKGSGKTQGRREDKQGREEGEKQSYPRFLSLDKISHDNDKQ